MWSSVKTEAIVLSVAPLREADRRYRALTPEFGKVEFIGRGAQKPRAKLAAHLEPGAIVELEIIKGMRSTTVIGVERKVAFSRLATSLPHRLLGLTSLALLDKTTQLEEEDIELYNELLLWLQFVDEREELHTTRSTLLLGGFLLRIMRQLGYNLELDACVGCGEAILPLSFRWHGGRGGLVCSDCVQRKPSEWFAAIPIREEVVTLMRLGRDAAFADLLRMPLKGTDVEAFAKCVHEQLGFHVPGYAEVPFWSGVMCA